jgi:WD40 repeat protein
MPRIFLSHSSKDTRQAVALKKWLVQQDRRLAHEIFLDLDPNWGILAGVKWKDALQQANAHCEAVICLLSTNWEASSECQTEFRTAETLNKRIFVARLEPSTGFGLTRDWQWVDLFGTGSKTEIDVDDGSGEPVIFLSEGLERLCDGITKAGIGADLFLWPPPKDPDRAPYRGWQPFEQEDAAVYFGRDAQIIRGLDALRGMRKSGVETLFVVLGPSGAGKSSFLRAGLLPRLQRNDRNFFLLDTVRPERNVLTGDTGLARAIGATRARFGEVTSVMFNSDGTQIVSGGGDGSVRVWDAIAGLPIPAGQREIRAAAFSPNGQLIASGGTDGTIKLWDAKTATPIGEPLGAPTPAGIERAITAVGFDHDGSRIVAGSNDGSVRVWDMTTRRPAELAPAVPADTPPTEEQKIKAVAFSPDNSKIVAAGNDGRLRLWDAELLQPIGTITTSTVEGKPYPIWAATFSPDSRKIVTGSGGYDNSLQIWNVDTLTPDGPAMVGHNGYQLYSVSYSPDGNHIVTGGYDGTTRVWDVGSRDDEVAVLAADQNPVLSVAYSHNGKWIASAGADGRVRLWDAEHDYVPIGVPLEGHKNWAATVGFSPDDIRILSGSWDGNLQLWQAPANLTDVLCAKLSTNMSEKQWREWVSPRIKYERACPDLPLADE